MSAEIEDAPALLTDTLRAMTALPADPLPAALSPAEAGVTLLSWFFVLDLTRYEHETRQRGR